ncbi:MAG TPA: hypothetical protein VGD29_03880 [Actinoplanes sp.]
MKTSRSCATVVLVAVLAVSACSKPAHAAWTHLELPVSGSLELHDLADCAGRWYAAGAVHDTGGTTHPAAWTSADGKAWTAVPFRPLPTSYYGPHQVILSVACSGGKVAMIGAVPGGAHGNPRVSTWLMTGTQKGDKSVESGVMAENPAPFETYGGEKAGGVGRIGAGPAGFAIAGDRVSGAAAWFSGDGRTFRLVEDAPGLADDAGHQTMARDAAALDDGRWAFVGGAAVRNSLDERAAVWLTTDGTTWARDDPPAATGYNEIQRVVRDGSDLVAAGVRGTRFEVWRWHAGTWTAGDAFGGDPYGVRSLTLAGGKPVVAGGGLWVDGSSKAAPAPPIAVAGRGNTLLMASTDGLWSTTV